MSRKSLDLLLSASLYLYFENHHSLTLTFSEGEGGRESILVRGVKAPGAQVLSCSLDGYLVSRKERKPNPFLTLGVVYSVRSRRIVL